MTDLQGALIGLLAKLESSDDLVTESYFSGEIRSLYPKDDSMIPFELEAEHLIFDLHPSQDGSESAWGTYFGPMLVVPDENNTVKEYPSIYRVTEKMIEYWEKRASDSKHPVMFARYADVVWDFGKQVTDKPVDYQICERAIDGYIQIARRGLYKHPVYVVNKLKRAISLALSLNNNAKVIEVKDTIIEYEKNIAEDDKPGLWGFSFDSLVENRRVKLTEDVTKSIICDLEDRLARLSTKDDIDVWAIELITTRLARYYKRHDLINEMERVLRAFGAAIEKAVPETSPMTASTWLQNLHDIYRAFNLLKDAEAVIKLQQKLGPKIVASMKPISHEVKIPKEDIEAFVDDTISGTQEEALIRIAVRFIPRKAKIEKEIRDLASKHPLQFWIKTELYDSFGRPVAKIGDINEDMDGHVVKQMIQNMQIEAIFLHYVLKGFVEKFSIDVTKCLNLLFGSPAFAEDREKLLSKGLDALLGRDAANSLHLLVPQIEAAIRKVTERIGGGTLKYSRSGVYDLKTLDTLLRATVLVESLGEDLATYLRVVLTDRRGMNIRNQLSHGIYSDNSFGDALLDRIFHVLICLSLLRVEKKENEAQ